MSDAVIVGAVRTPVGRRKGSLAAVHPVDLSAHVLRALAERTGIDAPIAAHVDDVVAGKMTAPEMMESFIARDTKAETD